MAPNVDQAQIQFSATNLTFLNIVLGLIMFGVALDLRIADFQRLFRTPKPVAIGLLCQFTLLPGLTFLLTRALEVSPSVALGMILVAACPGGNVSNFLTHLARGRTTTSVGMTAVSTCAAIVMTPINVSFWGSLHPETAKLVTTMQIEPLAMFWSISQILGLPILLGMFTAHRFPVFAGKVRRPFKILSILFFVTLVVVVFRANIDNFLTYIGVVFWPVFIMNAAALGLGYGIAAAARLDRRDRRAISIEVGIQNSGLGLILIFNFFAGLGGMAVIAAWWGLWHIISGLTLALFWSRTSSA